MVMGIDASEVKWTADWDKSQIIQDVTIDGSNSDNASGALAARPKKTMKKKDE